MSDPKKLSAPVPPGGTIGILGGGQLGRMLALAAARLGLKTHIYSDEAQVPAFQVSAAHTIGRYDDEAALKAFAAKCDAVTFEFENVPSAAVDILSQAVPTNPNAKVLAACQDRLEEKNFVRKLGIKTAEFAPAADAADIQIAVTKVGTPAVLKTRRLGYDGKGQAKVKSIDDAVRALASFKGAPVVVEDFIDFAFEASVVAARGLDGSFAAYDPSENLHGDHILRRSTVPSRLTPAQIAEARNIAKRIAEAFDYAGVLCVELFVTKDGALLVNEIAPRVHNSGHWTLEACAISQFEQHIRAIAGWPLGDPARHSNAVMENLIGQEAANWLKLAKSGGALHLYGKAEIRKGRKMGHVTKLSPKG